MKPLQSLIFLAAVGFLVGTVIYLQGGTNINISKSISFKIPTYNDVFIYDTVQYADISHLINKKNTTDSITQKVKTKNDTLAEIDSLFNTDTIIYIDPVVAAEDIYKLEFPSDNPHVLDNFFSLLASLKKTRQHIRIVHYGDSQIEGGRISSVVREKLQRRFGGGGPGFLPIHEENKYSCQMNFRYEGNWKKHTRYGVPESQVEIKHSRWGSLASISRFAPVKTDTSSKKKTVYTAKLNIFKKQFVAFPLRNQFSQIKLISGNSRKPVFVELLEADSLLNMTVIDTGKVIRITKWNVPPITDTGFTITFSGEDSPDFYGIALEHPYGISVDNVPMRGSSGLEFLRISQDQLTEMYKLLNVKLFFIEFGVNVVPCDVEDFSFYESGLSRNIQKLKEACPDAAVIVIGLSDMCVKNGEKYETHKNVEKVRDIQKKVAFKTGSAFWDMYEAMGGRNSMPSWVFAKPPLGQPDFTHFNYDGSLIIGEMFYNALNYEFEKYLKNSNLQ
ncbi:MAG: hypothetical protein IPO21_01390 [Bacteroidales bacterium]|nr:hypothetical protein [Bacteroidales bacterium]